MLLLSGCPAAYRWVGGSVLVGCARVAGGLQAGCRRVVGWLWPGPRGPGDLWASDRQVMGGGWWTGPGRVPGRPALSTAAQACSLGLNPGGHMYATQGSPLDLPLLGKPDWSASRRNPTTPGVHLRASSELTCTQTAARQLRAARSSGQTNSRGLSQGASLRPKQAPPTHPSDLEGPLGEWGPGAGAPQAPGLVAW